MEDVGYHLHFAIEDPFTLFAERDYTIDLPPMTDNPVNEDVSAKEKGTQLISIGLRPTPDPRN